MTASLLIPIVLVVTLWASSGVFGLFVAIFASMAAWELSGFFFRTLFFRLVYASSILAAAALTLNWPLLAAQSITGPIGMVAIGFWLLALLGTIRFARGGAIPWLASSASQALAGWMMLVPAVVSLITLHAVGMRHELILLFIVVWVADSGAYFIGRRFGRHPLAARVSPAKSIEGAFGGAILVLIIITVVIIGWYRDIAPGRGLALFGNWHLIVLCEITGLISIVGDLFESVLKRLAAKKDSGTLLPGHGGLLDRIDSLAAAAPCFAIGLFYLERSL